ncbi:MAG: L-lactate permease [Nitrospirota bacterium]
MKESIDVSFWPWIVAATPLAAILILLVGLRWKAATAAPVGYFIATIAALTLFRASPRIIALQTVKGIWDAIFILYVIVPALLLYQVSKEAGAFQALRRGIEAYTPNDLLHVLAFGWVFASFLQGITGFGAPIAVTAPLLVAVGVVPVWAVIIPLIGHAWANTFGTLAVAWNGLQLVTEMQSPATTAIIAAVMLLLANLLAGLTIAWLFGKGRGIREGLPVVLIVSAVHSVGQLILAPLVPELASFLPATVAVGVVIMLGRSRWYRNPTGVETSRVMQKGELQQQRGEDRKKERTGGGSEQEEMSLPLALSPYFVLIALIVLVLLIPPVKDALSAFQIGLSFPELETGRGVVTEAADAYSAFSPLTHPGTFLLLSAIFAFVTFRWAGTIDRGRMDEVLIRTIRTSIPSAIALFALVPLAKVMEGSGQTLELALGIAGVATGTVYAFVAPLIGAVGSFMTSSNLSSNILFGPLQERTAAALGVAQAAILAGQTAGAAIGNSIAPSNVLLGIGSVGLTGKTGEVIRRTITYMLAGVLLAGAVSLLYVLFLSGGAGGSAQ